MRSLQLPRSQPKRLTTPICHALAAGQRRPLVVARLGYDSRRVLAVGLLACVVHLWSYLSNGRPKTQPLAGLDIIAAYLRNVAG